MVDDDTSPAAAPANDVDVDTTATSPAPATPAEQLRRGPGRPRGKSKAEEKLDKAREKLTQRRGRPKSAPAPAPASSPSGSAPGPAPTPAPASAESAEKKRAKHVAERARIGLESRDWAPILGGTLVPAIMAVTKRRTGFDMNQANLILPYWDVNGEAKHFHGPMPAGIALYISQCAAATVKMDRFMEHPASVLVIGGLAIIGQTMMAVAAGQGRGGMTPEQVKAAQEAVRRETEKRAAAEPAPPPPPPPPPEPAPEPAPASDPPPNPSPDI